MTTDRDIALVRAALEAAGNLVSSLELLDPSGLSKKEQLRIYDVLNKAEDSIRALDPAAIAAAMPETSCAWTEDESGEYWETECGKAFTITSGTPSDNEMRHCCYCGKLLREAA